ncbi:nitroreductase, partial [Nocardia sp. NPDC060220]
VPVPCSRAAEAAACTIATLASYAPFIRDYFAIPDTRKVVFGISFGHPDTTHPINTFRTARAPLEDQITWHTS